ncbi:MAG: hypothetical protein QW348_08690 [Ignisphaera sp.]
MGSAAGNDSLLTYCNVYAVCVESYGNIYAVSQCSSIEQCIECVVEMILTGAEVRYAALLDVESSEVVEIDMGFRIPRVSRKPDDYLNAEELEITCKDIRLCVEIAKMFKHVKYMKIASVKDNPKAILHIDRSHYKDYVETIKQLRKIQIKNISQGICAPTINIEIPQHRVAIPIKIRFIEQSASQNLG